MYARSLGFALLAGIVLSSPLASQQIVSLPLGSWANDVTPDGEVVVGTWNYYDGFIWRWRTQPAPTVVLGGDLIAVSDDGTVACGNMPDPGGSGQLVAGLWTAAGGWQSLGYVPGTPLLCGGGLSTAYDISGDGTTVVGLAWNNGCNGQGFRWTAATGLQLLQGLANGNNRCSAISGDGSSLGGFAQGTFNRTPAYWNPDTTGAVLDVSSQGEVLGFDENGGKSVGTRWFGGAAYGAFLRDGQSGVFTNLGSLQGGQWNGMATDLAEGAGVVIGFDQYNQARKAWVWTAADGMKSLNDRLTALGVTGAPPLWVCRAVSDDGNVVVGGAQDPVGGPFGFAGFIVELASPQPQWTDLGSGLAGTNGIPLLKGTGSLVSGSSTAVTLTKAKAGASMAFVVGFSPASLSFKGGVLVPFPDLLLAATLPPSGSLALQFPWPAGVPSGFSTYWQCVVGDTAAPAKFALSNALRSTTP